MHNHDHRVHSENLGSFNDFVNWDYEEHGADQQVRQLEQNKIL